MMLLNNNCVIHHFYYGEFFLSISFVLEKFQGLIDSFQYCECRQARIFTRRNCTSAVRVLYSLSSALFQCESVTFRTVNMQIMQGRRVAANFYHYRSRANSSTLLLLLCTDRAGAFATLLLLLRSDSCGIKATQPLVQCCSPGAMPLFLRYLDRTLLVALLSIPRADLHCFIVTTQSRTHLYNHRIAFVINTAAGVVVPEETTIVVIYYSLYRPRRYCIAECCSVNYLSCCQCRHSQFVEPSYILLFYFGRLLSSNLTDDPCGATFYEPDCPRWSAGLLRSNSVANNHSRSDMEIKVLSVLDYQPWHRNREFNSLEILTRCHFILSITNPVSKIQEYWSVLRISFIF